MKTKKSGSVEDGLTEVAKKITETNKKNSNRIQWTQDRIEDLKEKNGKVGALPLDLIKTHKNIRSDLNEKEEEFSELVESIKKHGILQPPVVTVYTNEHGVHSILLVGGERRLRAAKKLGFSSINCLVKQFDSNSTRLTASMSENMNRKDLHPLDIANCYFELNKQGYKQVELVKMFGRDRKAIGRYIKIAQWPENVKKLIREHPDKFNIKLLMTIASKSMDPIQLEQYFENMLSEDRSKKPRLKPINKRVDEYFSEQNFSEEKRGFILQVLKDLSLIKEKTLNITGEYTQ